MKSIYKLLLISLIITVFTDIQAGDDHVGKLKSETCLGCHAIPGYNNVYPTYKVPKLAGQHAEYVISALKAYQKNDRKHPTMKANALALTDQDITDIANYFESLR
tara:strand:- start:391 stop:705 length:315 start_codon:yes stop_codon:yes gene_type:complete